MSLVDPAARLRSGIIGAGFMGATHARAIRAAGGQVVAAVGSSPGSASSAALRIGATEGLPNVEALLARNDIDVIHICTPNSSHEHFAAAALAAGKWIVCEKPLSVTASSAQRIVEVAATAGLSGTVPFVYRFHPMVRELRHRIAEGQLGVPSVVHGGYLQDWLASADETNWRADSAEGGLSRAFADIGSHWFDLFEFVTGDTVDRVSAQTLTVFPNRGGHLIDTEDAVTVQFRTTAGMLGTMVVSQVAAGRKNRLHLEISGSDASFAFDQENPDQLWRGNAEGGTSLTRDPGQLSSEAARLAYLPGGHPQGYQDAFNAFVKDSYALFAGTASLVVRESAPQLSAGLRAAELCDAVIASAKTDGAWTTTTHNEPASRGILTHTGGTPS